MKSPLFCTDPCGQAWCLTSGDGDRLVLFPDGAGRVWFEDEPMADGGYAFQLPPGLRAFVFAAATVAEVTLEAAVNARDGSDIVVFVVVRMDGFRARRFAWTPRAESIDDADTFLARDADIDAVVYHPGGNRLVSRADEAFTLSEVLQELLHQACEVATEASDLTDQP